MSLMEKDMDVIKTSLILAIAITFYYLLLQWPQGSDMQANNIYEDNKRLSIDSSEYLQTKPLLQSNRHSEFKRYDRTGNGRRCKC
jgi:hypothetical protein